MVGESEITVVEASTHRNDTVRESRVVRDRRVNSYSRN